MNLIPVLTLLIAFQAPAAQAALLDSCKGWFARLGGAESRAVPGTSAAWQAAFGPEGTHPYLRELQLPEGDLLFAQLWIELPPEVANALKGLPRDKVEARKFLERLLGSDSAVLASDSYLTQLLRRFRDSGGEMPFSEWIDHRLSALAVAQKKDPALLGRIAKLRDQGRFRVQAQRKWQSAGELRAPVVTQQGRTYLQLGEERLEAWLENDRWTVLVPRSRVAHPAWNPVDREKVGALLRAGIKPPKSYQTGLGHDGRFYLLDGNHRFELDPRSRIPVQIPNPPKTLSLKLMLDMIGSPQPSEAELLDYAAGRIGWRDLIKNPEAAGSFVLQPK